MKAPVAINVTEVRPGTHRLLPHGTPVVESPALMQNVPIVFPMIGKRQLHIPVRVPTPAASFAHPSTVTRSVMSRREWAPLPEQSRVKQLENMLCFEQDARRETENVIENLRVRQKALLTKLSPSEIGAVQKDLVSDKCTTVIGSNARVANKLAGTHLPYFNLAPITRQRHGRRQFKVKKSVNPLLGYLEDEEESSCNK